MLGIVYNCGVISTYRQAVLIFNPQAGRLRNGGKLIRRAEEILTRSGTRVQVAPTPGPNAAAAVSKDAIAAGADLILACGGDGTINEVAEGMIGSDVPLAILPGGTANVLANEIGIGSRLEHAAKELFGLVPRRVSAGRFRARDASARHFLLMAGVGLDAYIVYKMSADLKKRWGKLAYWIGGFSQLTRDLEEFDVDLDGRRTRASFALVTKVRNYGGDLEIARNVTMLDDTFEMVLFEGNQSLRYLKYFTGVVANRLPGMEGVTIVRARCARFTAPMDSQVYVQVDGEYAGRLPSEVEIVPNALTLLMPPQYAARRH